MDERDWLLNVKLKLSEDEVDCEDLPLFMSLLATLWLIEATAL